jgi:hypothetical protein
VLWLACRGAEQIRPLRGTLWRLVESQEQIATLGYVDTLEEQALLESLLEESKPPYPEDSGTYHYLLRSPFRYPPLPWGSRFGSRREPSLLYGGGCVETTLAESAYYRFVFWQSMVATPPKPRMRSEHTLFNTTYATQNGVQLQEKPFDEYRTTLADPERYGTCQALGSAMREAGVEAFEYRSARDARQRHCVALFTPRALGQRKPRLSAAWVCELTASDVAFMALGSETVFRFELTQFLVAGALPNPPT